MKSYTRISSKPVNIEVFFAKLEIIILSWRSYHGVLYIWCPKNDPCHKLSYVKETGVKVEEFENDEIEILRLMAGLEKLQTICFHHEYILLRITSHLDQVL